MVKEPSCDVAAISRIVSKNAPDARCVSNVGAELAFVLEKSNLPRFPQLFHELDARIGTQGLTSYGISVTTMEDVFLRVWMRAMFNVADVGQVNKNSHLEHGDEVQLSTDREGLLVESSGHYLTVGSRWALHASDSRRAQRCCGRSSRRCFSSARCSRCVTSALYLLRSFSPWSLIMVSIRFSRFAAVCDGRLACGQVRTNHGISTAVCPSTQVG